MKNLFASDDEFLVGNVYAGVSSVLPKLAPAGDDESVFSMFQRAIAIRSERRE